jgi:hypothetical protein
VGNFIEGFGKIHNNQVCFDSKNILYDLQHGFRKARSCESQLLPFIQELTTVCVLSDKNA